MLEEDNFRIDVLTEDGEFLDCASLIAKDKIYENTEFLLD